MPWRLPVHPRLRGELLFLIEIFAFCNGSSPLTRGTQTQPEQCFMNRRFIPAYAGNSSAQLRFLALDAVHPRLRGELHRKAVKTICSTGSSPLTRGTRIEITSFNVHNRFIPAYAGNSCKAQFRFRTNRGSSPLTRGTPRPLQINLRPHRFIPAYAGNSLISRASVIDSAVHPRLRGELPSRTSKYNAGNGSSPLTRGTHKLL